PWADERGENALLSARRVGAFTAARLDGAGRARHRAARAPCTRGTGVSGGDRGVRELSRVVLAADALSRRAPLRALVPHADVGRAVRCRVSTRAAERL